MHDALRRVLHTAVARGRSWRHDDQPPGGCHYLYVFVFGQVLESFHRPGGHLAPIFPPAVGEGHPENFAGCHGFIVVRILRLVPELFATRLGSGSASDARTEPVVAQVQEEPVGSGTPLAPSPERRRDQWPVFAAGRQADVYRDRLLQSSSAGGQSLHQNDSFDPVFVGYGVVDRNPCLVQSLDGPSHLVQVSALAAQCVWIVYTDPAKKLSEGDLGFTTAAALVHELMEARDERRLLSLQKQLSRLSLLIVDELGFVPLSTTGAELLFEVFSQRYERGSILMTTNLPFDEWTEVFGSERLTGAMLDRLTHHVHILEMNGESYRLRRSRENAGSQSPDDA